MVDESLHVILQAEGGIEPFGDFRAQLATCGRQLLCTKSKEGTHLFELFERLFHFVFQDFDVLARIDPCRQLNEVLAKEPRRRCLPGVGI